MSGLGSQWDNRRGSSNKPNSSQGRDSWNRQGSHQSEWSQRSQPSPRRSQPSPQQQNRHRTSDSVDEDLNNVKHSQPSRQSHPPPQPHNRHHTSEGNMRPYSQSFHDSQPPGGNNDPCSQWSPKQSQTAPQQQYGQRTYELDSPPQVHRQYHHPSSDSINDGWMLHSSQKQSHPHIMGNSRHSHPLSEEEYGSLKQSKQNHNPPPKVSSTSTRTTAASSFASSSSTPYIESRVKLGDRKESKNKSVSTVMSTKEWEEKLMSQYTIRPVVGHLSVEMFVPDDQDRIIKKKKASEAAIKQVLKVMKERAIQAKKEEKEEDELDGYISSNSNKPLVSYYMYHPKQINDFFNAVPDYLPLTMGFTNGPDLELCVCPCSKNLNAWQNEHKIEEVVLENGAKYCPNKKFMPNFLMAHFRDKGNILHYGLNIYLKVLYDRE
eukprot:scaffold69613_cov58-Attheya_sp.AAC.3